jgi:hypothetical protein
MANAGKTYLISSQRELVSTFGTPQFYKDSNGTPLHGYEINEYGLMAAYSALGVSNRVYMLRADIDLAQLVGTSVRPTAAPANGTVWLDLADTRWGLFEWDADTKTFVNIDSPTLITSVSQLVGSVVTGAPLQTIGSVGDYAIVVASTQNSVYYKCHDNTWQEVGSDDWCSRIPAIISGYTNPSINASHSLFINTQEVTLTAATIANVASRINTAAITGITAFNDNGVLKICADSTATSDGSTVDGQIHITAGTGTLLANLGITAGFYKRATFVAQPHTQVPSWKTSGTDTRPSGSVWAKTTSPNAGANYVVKVYNSLTKTWNTSAATLSVTESNLNTILDPAGGGANIAQGSFAVIVNSMRQSPTVAEFELHTRAVYGATVITGTATNPTLSTPASFTIGTSVVGGTSITNTTSVTVPSSSLVDLVTAIQSLNIENLTVSITTAGAIQFTHTKGGNIVFNNTSGTPLTTLGITSSTPYVTLRANGTLAGSNWVAATYTASMETPSTDPETGTYWYDSVTNEVDIMIHDGNTWKGYKNVTNDARGYNLFNTDPAGPIVSASEPETQTDGSALVYGDLWIDTSDLENYPKIYRYDNVSGMGKWQLIDNTDQTTENGILFADARWATNGTTDVITDDKPTIVSLQSSNHLDIDAPVAANYPRGMLLWNTRRSGYNVKKFVYNYFNATDFPDDTLPDYTNAWVNASGNRNDGSPYMGRKAARVIITSAMAAVVSTSTEIREEQRNFNLITCPGYPELADEMIALNNDRKSTAFIIADTPMRLAANGTVLQNWALGNDYDSITNADPYVGVFYPSGVTSNPFTTGNAEILVPPSHMALRVIIRNDDVAFPWFAPAGLRRGLVDNATRVGYIDAATGELQTVGITEALRDTLYENKINPITYLPGTGLVVYGQKTLNPYASALDRINVARLVVYIRERLQQIVKPFLFEPNDKITRDEAKQVVESLMNDLVAKRGLYDYLVICDTTNNTPDRIDRNELYIDVAIEPVKAVEFIYIPVRIKNTGSIAAGT